MSKLVLVTGADGFIGSHLVEYLHANTDYDIRALVQYNSFNSWGWLDSVQLSDRVSVVSGDIRDNAVCQTITKGVATLYNLAALIAIPYSYQAPKSYVDTNIQGTINLCQAALQNNVEKVVQVSTSEVYGTAQYVPIDEKHPLQPQSPYSASKIGSDALAMSFYNSFELPVVLARPFNTYGPRQSARAVIPTIISQLAVDKPCIQLGDLTPTRDFNYVKDTCKGLYLLSEQPEAVGQTVNIGTGKDISIGDLFSLLCELMGKHVDVSFDSQRKRPKDSEVYRLLADTTLLSNLTAYKPDNSLRQGLAQTIDWFTQPENLAKYKTEIYNV